MADVYGLIDGFAYFTGSETTGGLVLYVLILLLLLVFLDNIKGRFFLIALPITLIMGAIGVLKSEVLYLILILNIIGVVTQYRRIK